MTTGRFALWVWLISGGMALGEPLPADCARLAVGLQGFGGYAVSYPPAPTDAGWCVFDHATFKGQTADLPDLKADRLRLRGTVDGTALLALEVEVVGLRQRATVSGGAKDNPLHAMFRLQSADLSLTAQVDPAADVLDITSARLVLSGGTEIALAARIAGADLVPASLASGRLLALDLDWRFDGQLMRPVMEAVGTELDPDAKGRAAVDAARSALRRVTEALPEPMLPDDSRRALERAIAALPLGRGRLIAAFEVTDGIGAARLIVAGLATDPLAPDALVPLFDGASLRVTWEPGL